MKHLEEQIKDEGRQLGFDLVGITTAAPLDSGHVAHLRDWLDSGFAGRMSYMHRNVDKRADPGELLPGARSVICVCGVGGNVTQSSEKSGDVARATW